MLKTFKLYLCLLFLFFAYFSFAQKHEKSWIFSGGFSTIIFNNDFPVPLNSGVIYSKDDFNNDFNGFTLIGLRKLRNGFSLGGEFSSNIISINNTSSSIELQSISAILQYHFLPTKSLNPYLKLGGGHIIFDDSNSGSIDVLNNGKRSLFGGVGVSYKIGKNYGFYAETTFRKTFSPYDTDILHSVVGISLTFSSSDKDMDSVIDKYDQCPNVFGLKKFKGCPDPDSNLIEKREDDNGIIKPEILHHKKIDTPLKEINPSDSLIVNHVIPIHTRQSSNLKTDTIAVENEIPRAKISKINLPKLDSINLGFSTLDSISVSSEIPVNHEESPKRVIKNDTVDFQNTYPSKVHSDSLIHPNHEIFSNNVNIVIPIINFQSNSFKLIGKKVWNTLYIVRTIMNQYDRGVLLIQGYSSTEGNENYNKELSKKRVEVVQRELIKRGIDSDRINIEYHGATNPIEDNLTAGGRVLNRRV